MAVVHGTMIVAQMVSLPIASDGGGKAGRLQGKVVSPLMEQPEVHRQVEVASWLAVGHTSVADAAPASAASSSRRMGAMVRDGRGCVAQSGRARAPLRHDRSQPFATSAHHGSTCVVRPG